MAAKSNNFDICDYSFAILSSKDEMKVIRLQAMVRGYQTRKQFQKLRDIYLDVFQELEGDGSWQTRFPGSLLCLPQFGKKSGQKSASLKNISKVTPDQNEQNVDQLSIVSDELSDTSFPSNRDQKTEEELLKFVENSDENSRSAEITDISSMASETGQDLDRKLSNSKKFTKHKLSSAMRNEIASSSTQEKDSSPRNVQNDEETCGSVSDVSSFLSNGNKEENGCVGQTEHSPSSIRSEVIESEPVFSAGGAADDIAKRSDASESAECEDVQATNGGSVNNTDERLSSEHEKSRDIFSNTIPETVPGMIHSTPQHDLTNVSRLAPGVELTNQKINFSDSFGDNTSMWDSVQSTDDAEIMRLAGDPVALEKVRENVSMELLWIQQAIDSRKNYLKLKKKLAGQEKAA